MADKIAHNRKPLALDERLNLRCHLAPHTARTDFLNRQVQRLACYLQQTSHLGRDVSDRDSRRRVTAIAAQAHSAVNAHYVSVCKHAVPGNPVDQLFIDARTQGGRKWELRLPVLNTLEQCNRASFGNHLLRRRIQLSRGDTWPGQLMHLREHPMHQPTRGTHQLDLAIAL